MKCHRKRHRLDAVPLVMYSSASRARCGSTVAGGARHTQRALIDRRSCTQQAAATAAPREWPTRITSWPASYGIENQWKTNGNHWEI